MAGNLTVGAGLPAALLLLWCAAAASAGERHFMERVFQSQQQQEQRRVRQPTSDETDNPPSAGPTEARRRPRLRIRQFPPTLRDALAKALSYEANRSRLTAAGRQPPPPPPPPSNNGRTLEDMWHSGHRNRPAPNQLGSVMPPSLKKALTLVTALSSDAQDDRVTSERQQTSQFNITERRPGCSCADVAAVPGRSLSFLVPLLPSPEDALVELHVPVAGGRVRAGPPLSARLTLCEPGAAGRSVAASLRLKRAPQRPRWRHAFVGDWLAVLRRPAGGGGSQCLLVQLPTDGALRLDRRGGRRAELTARPTGPWRS